MPSPIFPSGKNNILYPLAKCFFMEDIISSDDSLLPLLINRLPDLEVKYPTIGQFSISDFAIKHTGSREFRTIISK